MEHRKPKTVSSMLDPDKQAAFIKSYNNLLNNMGDDEAVLFGDAVHPTHAVRPVGCWAPKDTPLAVPQTSGRQHLNIHGAIDLETGKTRMIEAATVNAISMIMLLRAIEAMYPGKRLIHLFMDNARYHHAKLVQAWLARTGCRIKLHFIPSPPLPAPLVRFAAKADRAAMGPDAQARHPQSMSHNIRRFQSGDPDLSARGGSRKMGYLL
jgi:hypothetical protein